MLLGPIRMVLVTALCLLWSLPALADKRIALVIGNGSYKESPLRNPVNDAKAMAAILKRLGFDVTLVTNGTLPRMQQAILSFGEALRGGGSGLFYYAGHGLQVKGQNYLVPVDADIASESAVRVTSVPVDLVTDQMGDAANGVNVIILDACRNNPFERRLRGGSRGLAAMDAARGTLIAYATAPGSVAADGDGDNGLYTSELLKALGEPNLKAEEVFKRVRAGVVTRTGGRQTPWESSSLTGDFVFNLTVNLPPAVSGGFDERQIELAYWSSIRDSTSPVPFRGYLERYPKGNFAEIARFRIDELEAKQKAGNTTPVPSPQVKQPSPPTPSPPPVGPAPTPTPQTAPTEVETGSWTYVARRAVTLRAEPNSNVRTDGELATDDIVQVIGRHLGGQWLKVTHKNVVGWVPSSALIEVSPAEVQAWDKAKGGKREASLQAFLKTYPQSYFAPRAKKLIQQIARPADPPAAGQIPSRHTNADGDYGNASMLREGMVYAQPDYHAQGVAMLPAGARLRILRGVPVNARGWYAVGFNEKNGVESRGYISRMYLTEDPEGPPPAATPESYGNARMMESAKIYANPDYLSAALASLPSGSRVRVTGEGSKGWYPIAFIGRDD